MDKIVTKKMSQLNYPEDIFVSNGEIFIADMYNHCVRKVLWNGQIVTICGNGIAGYNGDDQLATNAQLNGPCSVVVSSSNQVYIMEMDGNRIRKIDQRGIITTIAGTGIGGYNGDDQLAANAQVNFTTGLFVTDDEQVLFADCTNLRVRMVDQNGIISTIAGKGDEEDSNEDGILATSASLYYPIGVFQYKNEVYIAEHQKIRKIDQNGIISTIVGNEGYNDDSNFVYNSIFVHNDQIYFSDANKNLIKKVLPNGSIEAIAGIQGEEGFNGDDMPATETKLYEPQGIFIDSGSQIYIADSGNNCIRMIDRNGMMKIIAGTACQEGYSGDVPFNFHKYPHIGPRKGKWNKPFPRALYDLIVITEY